MIIYNYAYIWQCAESLVSFVMTAKNLVRPLCDQISPDLVRDFVFFSLCASSSGPWHNKSQKPIGLCQS